jgi:hypothetical protein
MGGAPLHTASTYALDFPGGPSFAPLFHAKGGGLDFPYVQIVPEHSNPAQKIVAHHKIPAVGHSPLSHVASGIQTLSYTRPLTGLTWVTYQTPGLLRKIWLLSAHSPLSQSVRKEVNYETCARSGPAFGKRARGCADAVAKCVYARPNSLWTCAQFCARRRSIGSH